MHLGILAVVPILVQWLLSSYTQTYSRKGRGSGGYEDAYNVNHLPPKSHWTLLAELQQVPEEDMELLLPQVLNILLDRDALQDSDELFMQFERILLFKCANSLPFGMRLSCLLKASAGAASERLFRNVLLSNSQQSQRREDRIRRLQERVETVSAQGMGLDANMRTLRINYFEDCKFLLDNLSRIGLELKSYPVKFRKRHLMNALRQCNSFIFHRMISKVNLPQPASQTQQPHPPGNREHRSAYNGHSYASHHSAPHYSEDVQRSHETDYFQSETTELSNMSPQEVAKLCPAAAFHSLHLPIQHSNDLTLRILRIVEEECEVLPSKERCPYLVVVEVMEQPYPVHSFLLYAHGFEAMKEIAEARLRAATATAGTSQPIGAANPEYAKSQDIRQTQQENRGDIDTEFSHSEESIAREVLLASSAAAASRANSPRQDFFVGDEYFNDPAAGKQNENVRDFARPDFGTPPRSYDSTHNPYDSNESGKEYSDPYAGLYDNTTPSSAPTQHKHSFTEQYSDDTRWSEGRPSDQSTSYCEPTVLAHPPFSQTGYSHRQTTVEEETQLCYPSPYPHPYPGPSDAYDYSQYRLQSSDECSYEGRGHGVVPVRKKTWIERREIVRSMSPFGQLEGWGLKAFIVKSGDDLRKEVLAMQLIEYCQKVFHSEGLDIFLRPYQIISTGRDCGLVEFIENAQSLDKIKKAYRPYASSRDASLNLRDYFEHSFGPGYSLVYSKALHNFVSSLVGYSLLTYLLQVKDRHNANIMIDSDGHIVHIDYGFIFGDSPGFNINFESAPFKFTGEYADVMGGLDSEAFRTFEDMFLRGFAALQRHAEGLSAIVELFYGEKKKSSAESLRTRLLFPASASDILGLIRDSLDNWRTKQYDWYQKKTNNIEI